MPVCLKSPPTIEFHHPAFPVTPDSVVTFLNLPPVFCKKDNEFTHVNYFSDKEGYIYIVCAPDFNSVKKNFNKSAKTNLKYTESADYQKSGGLHVYIKAGNNATGSLQDITNNKTINASSNKSGYAVFKINPVSLGMYRFKLKQ